MPKGRNRVIIAKDFGNFTMYYGDREGESYWSVDIERADKMPRKVAEFIVERMKFQNCRFVDACAVLVEQVMES